MTETLLVLTILLPLCLALGYAWRGFRYRLMRSLPWAAAPGLALAFLGDTQPLAIPWLVEGALWGLDDLRRVFLGFTSLLWLVSGLFARFYFSGPDRSRHFAVFWLLTLSGNLGLILARDIAGFYTFFALMTLAAYGLVAHERTPEAVRAARVYVVMALAGEMALLAGLIMAAAPEQLLLLADVPQAVAASDYRNWIVALLFGGFGVKAGALFLHFWLPLAHPAAPTPASAVLSGAMIKAGLFGWIYTLPMGETALPGWSALIMSMGLLAAFGAGLIGVCQRVPKAVLAYSSISQMGLMTTMVGVGLAVPELWAVLMAVITLYATHHGLAKGALFLSAGAAEHAGHWPRWLFWALVWLPGLSLTGLLLTSGAAGKGAFKALLHEAEKTLGYAPVLETLFSLAAVATTLLVARYVWCLRSQRAKGEPQSGLMLSWTLATACSLFLFWFMPRPEMLPNPASSLGFFSGLSTGIAKPLGFLWPTAMGLLLAGLAAWMNLRPLGVPAGDLLVVLERLWSRCRSAILRAAAISGNLQSWIVELSRDGGGRLLRVADRLLHGEQQLRARSGLTFAAVLILLLLALLVPWLAAV